MEHVVWDWNGTLFDDNHLVVEGLNAVLDDAGFPRVDITTYRRLYTRPVQRFYEQLFGRPIGEEEWRHLDDTYHVGYRAALDRAGLATDAEDALTVVRRSGGTQSLLSMWRHPELVTLVERLGIHDHFARIDGLRGTGGGHKAPFLMAHIERMSHLIGEEPSRVLVIGDALDDAIAATELGARCVLYDGGSHPREHLEATGLPVASTLTEALELGGFN